VSQITVLFLYVLAAACYMAGRLPRFESRARPLFIVAVILAATGVAVHAQHLFALVLPRNGFDLSINNAASIIGLELAIIALVAGVETTLRGTSGGLLLLAAALATLMGQSHAPGEAVELAWQVRAHILTALLSYGLLTVGALVAIYMLVLERRLHAARLSPVNRLFAPLETTEKLLIGITATGFAGLTLAIVSGTTFVNDLLGQHLAHKFGLSILAWLIFGTLLAGRFVAGWRGRRAVKLYLWGFAALCLAYFGSRYILEEILHRSWWG